jgi:hypothetical protein
MNLAQILLIVAVIIFVIVRRFASEPLQARSLLIPAGLTIWGGYQLRGHHLSAVDIAFLAVSLIIGFAGGAARGATVAIFTKNGHLWQRYRLTTLGVWVALILVRLGLMAAAHLVGADLATDQSTMLMLGASLLAETLVVGQRALRTGVPFAPSRRRSRISTGYR